MPETADVREVPLTRGFVAIVDAADYDAVMALGKWHVEVTRTKTYARRNTRLPDGRRAAVFMHTFLMGSLGVDHVDGDGLNNCRSNLRRATSQQNMWNKRLQVNNTSGYKGVHWKKDRGWCARIVVDGRKRHLGYFPTPEAGAEAYNAAALELFGEFAHLNQLPGAVA